MKKDIYFHGDYSPRYKEGYNIVEKAKEYIKEQKRTGRKETESGDNPVNHHAPMGEETKRKTVESGREKVRIKKCVKKLKKSIDKVDMP